LALAPREPEESLPGVRECPLVIGYNVTREDVERGLDAYVEAWKSYDRGQIERLFSRTLPHRYHPEDDAARGAPRLWSNPGGEGDNPKLEAPTTSRPTTTPTTGAVASTGRGGRHRHEHLPGSAAARSYGL